MEKRFIIRNHGRFGDYVLTDDGFACGERPEEEAVQFTEAQAKAVCETLKSEAKDTTEAYFYDECKKPYQFVDTNVKYESSKKEWEYLKPEVKTKFITNIRNLCGEEFLGRLTSGGIVIGFAWSESPEGGKYWWDVEKEVHRYLSENE